MNSYLREFRKVHNPRPGATDYLLDAWESRDALTSKYSWAVPNALALATIGKTGKVLELGAGTGYWAMLLRQRGVNVIAADPYPSGWSPTTKWIPDIKTRSHSPRLAARHHDRTLFISWSHFETEWDYRALLAYRTAGGQRFCYVGESEGGCTGSAPLWEELDEHWTCRKRVELPQWRGLHDELVVWTPKAVIE